MTINTAEAAALLLKAERVVILAHRKPDGDTLGCAYALSRALHSLGKQSRVECADPVPPRYRFLLPDGEQDVFEPDFVLAVDTADTQLLGGLAETYAGRIDLCVDHHKSNKMFAAHTLLEITAAAGEVVYRLILALGVRPDAAIADALFAAISSDTGGFRYADVTSATHRIAADLIDYGADHAGINRLIFETKTRGRIEIDRLMLETIEFHFDGLCSVITIPHDIKERYSVTEDELDGISSLPRTIDGVYAGVTLRENEDGGSFRLSLRARNPVDASAICGVFGGGGHTNAAGATLTGSLDEVREAVLAQIKLELTEKKLWKAY